jgi:hypothetical protein
MPRHFGAHRAAGAVTPQREHHRLLQRLVLCRKREGSNLMRTLSARHQHQVLQMRMCVYVCMRALSVHVEALMNAHACPCCHVTPALSWIWPHTAAAGFTRPSNCESV